jgi:SAM-dependent methyltransferase
MTLIREHIPFYREIFNLPDFWQEKLLMIGLPYTEGSRIPEDFKFQNLKDLVLSHGLKKVYSVDLYDVNADFRWDLNLPISKNFHNSFKVVIDIGTLEHIFDTRQCLENYFRLIEPGGLFVLVTPVNGFFGHGLHVFNPETLLSALDKNGFKVMYKKFTTSTGIEISDPNLGGNILLWIVAKKLKKINEFIIPQQGYWKKTYTSKKSNNPETRNKETINESFNFYLGEFKRWILRKFPIVYRTKLYRQIRKYG